MENDEGEYKRRSSGMDLKGAKQGQEIANYISAGFALVTGGASELLAPAIRRVMDRRIAELREALLNDLQAGIIGPDTVIQEDDLASFIIRIQRAAVEGCAKQKLQLMIRYFFGHAGKDGYREDMFLNFAGIAEQLSHNELKCLAIIKAAIVSGAITKNETGDDGTNRNRNISKDVDLLGLFLDKADFNTAAASLVRFGFIKMASGWGSIIIFASDQVFEFLDSIEFEHSQL
jgi:hypothetical protein